MKKNLKIPTSVTSHVTEKLHAESLTFVCKHYTWKMRRISRKIWKMQP